MQPEVRPTGAYRPVTIEQLSPARQRVLRNTYLLLALTMVPTVIGAFAGIATASVFFTHPVASTLIAFAGIFAIQYGIIANRNSGVGVALLLLMTFLLGWWLGPILSIALKMSNGTQLIGLAAGGTAVVLLVMSSIATTSKRDFGFMGKFLLTGMVILIVAMFANLFLHIPALALTISAAAVVVFSLFLLYEVSRIVNGGEDNYIVATTGVYLSLYNVFVNLLYLLMALMGNDRR